MTYLIIVVLIVIIILYLIFRPKRPSGDTIILTDEFKDVLNILENTDDSIFVSGKAGTGKSTLLKYFTDNTGKKHVILAPTGVAAMNVNGQTIHSFFRFPLGLLMPQTLQPDFVRNNLFQGLQVVIIDEVSMVRADIMDGIDRALRINRNRIDEPFGGVQMVFIGDLFQLPPVVKDKDKQQYISDHYGSEYFFDAPVFKQVFRYQKKELTRVFRQKDEAFIKMLDRIRINEADYDDLVLLNSRHRDNVGESQEGAVLLTTTNAIARRINKENLDKIHSKEFIYQAYLTGTLEKELNVLLAKQRDGKLSDDELEDRMEREFPTNVNLKLKKEAQIIMLKNDVSKRWFNGTLGTVVKLEDNNIWVNIERRTYKVERALWEKYAYTYDVITGEITKEPKGSFSQFPIKLAWAMTIHKGQGKTLDRVIIDIGRGAFAHGQTYVALSRCKTLEGIILNKQINQKDIIVDNRVVQFYKQNPST